MTTLVGKSNLHHGGYTSPLPISLAFSVCFSPATSVIIPIKIYVIEAYISSLLDALAKIYRGGGGGGGGGEVICECILHLHFILIISFY